MAKELTPWELLDRRLLVAHRPWLALYQDRIRLPSGRELDDFYRVEMPDFAVVAALTPERQFVLVRGYKHGLGRVTLCAPAGHVEPGEEPLTAAQRELREETGYAAAEWQALGTFLTDGNRHCGTAYFFLATEAVRVGEPHVDELEEVRVELTSPQRVRQALRDGDVALVPTASVLALALAHGVER